jgi:alanyl-tRNA synthetase
VAQRGSLNAPDRLRFDFSHTKGMSEAELAQVEQEVNASSARTPLSRPGS